MKNDTRIELQTTEKTGWLAHLALATIQHSKASALIWLVIVAVGLLSYLSFMQREGFPNVEVPISTVSGTFFVNNRTKVDSEVVKPILEEAHKNAEVKKTTATSLDNGFNIVIQYKDGVDASKASENLQKLIQDNSILPAQATAEFEAINASKFLNEYDTLIAVNSDTTDPQVLDANATKFAEALNKKIAPSTATVIPLVKTGTNPLTNQPITQQQSFDFSSHLQNGQLSSPTSSVIIGIKNPNGTDIIKFDEKLTKALDELNSRPELIGVHGSISADQASSIKEQIHLLQDNLLEGLLIVALVCMLFISFRAGIIAVLGMVGTLAMTLAVLYLLGITLNTITLFGLILCLGLIVDDTVIMAEAIDKYKDKSKSFNETVKTAANHVAVASLAGTITTILAFAPLLFVSGILGQFIRVLPITIIISLAISLLASITLIPLLASKIDRKPSRDWRKTIAKYNPFRWVEQAISSTGSGIILWSKSPLKKLLVTFIAIGISIEFIIIGAQFFSQLKFDIFPSTKDGDVIALSIDFPPTNTLSQNIEISKRVNTIIIDTIGDQVERISYNGSGTQRSATIQIRLKSYTKRDVTSKQLISKLQEQISSYSSQLSNSKITVVQLDAGPPKDNLPFKVQIVAEDRSKADLAAKKLTEYLNTHSITRITGDKVAITEVQYDGQRPSLTRSNGVAIVQVEAGFAADDTSALVQNSQKDVESFIQSESNRSGLSVSDYRFDFGNESSNQDSFKTVLIAFPILLAVMYVLLVIQFKSIFQPLLIFMAIPFSFFGVGLGLYLTGNPLSFFVMVGFFALIGISVNNTILLTDFANQRRKLGDGPRDAIANALSARVRPLLTTSITAVVALIPLALTNPFWESLAVTLIFGLISSAFLVIVAFPYYYLILEGVRMRTSRHFKKLLS